MMSREMENCVYAVCYIIHITYNNKKEIWKIQKGYRYRSDVKLCAYNNSIRKCYVYNHGSVVFISCSVNFARYCRHMSVNGYHNTCE